MTKVIMGVLEAAVTSRRLYAAIAALTSETYRSLEISPRGTTGDPATTCETVLYSRAPNRLYQSTPRYSSCLTRATTARMTRISLRGKYRR